MTGSPWAENFTYDYYRRLLAAVTGRFSPRLFREAPRLPAFTEPSVFLRHDIDVSLGPALRMAIEERQCGVVSTYMVMTRSRLYDIASSESSRLLREIAAMGHEVGVHYDCPEEQRGPEIGPGHIQSMIAEDCSRLEDALGGPVHSISFHRPIPSLLNGPLSIGGRVNAYAAELMQWYLSDSKGSWRNGEPLGRVSDDSKMVFQLLTHPIWWGESHAQADERLESFFRDETRHMSAEDAAHFDQILLETVPGVRRAGV